MSQEIGSERRHSRLRASLFSLTPLKHSLVKQFTYIHPMLHISWRSWSVTQWCINEKSSPYLPRSRFRHCYTMTNRVAELRRVNKRCLVDAGKISIWVGSGILTHRLGAYLKKGVKDWDTWMCQCVWMDCHIEVTYHTTMHTYELPLVG